MPVYEGERPGGGGFAVQVGSVAEAAAMLARTGEQLNGDLDRLIEQAIAGFGAIPMSDLQDAYGYCWGRWSQALEDVRTALGEAGQLTDRSAGSYAETEQTNAGLLGPRIPE